MSVREFRDDDAGYLAWLAAHPDGYVSQHRAQPQRDRSACAPCRLLDDQRSEPRWRRVDRTVRESLRGAAGRARAVGERPGGEADPAVRDLPLGSRRRTTGFNHSGPNGRSHARCPRVAPTSTDRLRAVR